MRQLVSRNKTIDFLRGVATLVMVVIHVTAYFLKDKNVYVLWDYAHFVVPIFVFCSAFVYFQKEDTQLSLLTIWKRIKRLIVPYYIFVVVLFATQYFFKIKMTDLSFADHLLLKEGRYINWLVVLFISFIFLFPFIGWLKKNTILLYTFTTICIFSTLYFFYNDFSSIFRYVMFVPWAAIALYGLYLSRTKKKNTLLIIILVLGTIVFFVTKWQLQLSHHSLVLIDHKYPPDIYYLAYGAGWISILYLLHEHLNLGDTFIQKPFDFLSKYSYQFFFIHYYFLFLLKGKTDLSQFGWFGVTIMLVILTFATIGSLEKAKSIFSRR